MTVQVGQHQFDTIRYDAGGDILVLTVDRGKGLGQTSPEGHVWYVDDGEVVGLSIEGARLQLEREGGIYVTLPTGERVRAAEAERVLR